MACGSLQTHLLLRRVSHKKARGKMAPWIMTALQDVLYTSQTELKKLQNRPLSNYPVLCLEFFNCNWNIIVLTYLFII